MGGKRKPEEEKTVTLTINLKRKILDKIELDGKPKHIIERMVLDKYGDEK